MENERKVKKINFGILLDEKPIERTRTKILQLGENRLLTTSIIEKVTSFYDETIWVVETQNSIYIVKKNRLGENPFDF